MSLSVNIRLNCLLWFRLMISDCQRVASRVVSWTDRGVRLRVVQPCQWLVVCRCGARVRWSTTKVKVMRDRANGSGTVKDKH
jgi:hypothetical protein